MKNINSIYEVLIKRYPSADIIFANSSYVPEHLQKTSSYRKNVEIQEYNNAVFELFNCIGVHIIDLYSFTKSLSTYYRQNDGLHFSEKGSELIAEYIISDIKVD